MSQPTPEQQAIIAELRDINRSLHMMMMQRRDDRATNDVGGDSGIDKFSQLLKQQSKANRADQAYEKAVTSSRIAYARHLNELAKSQSQSLSHVTKMISEQRRMSDMMLNSMTNAKKDEARIVREFQKAFASGKSIVDGFSSKIKTLEDVLKAEELSKTLLKAQSVYENAAKSSIAKNETLDVDGIRDVIEELRKQQMLSDDEIRKVLPGMLEAYEGMAGHQAEFEKQLQNMRSSIEASIQKGLITEEEANKKRADEEAKLREQLIKTLEGMKANSSMGGHSDKVAETAGNFARTQLRATGKSFAKLDGITKNVNNRFTEWASNLASSDAIIENFKRALKGATEFTSNQFTHGVETTVSGALSTLGKGIAMGMDPDKMVEIYTKYAGQRRREGSDVFNKYMEQGVEHYLQNAGFNRSDAAKMMMENMDTFIQSGVTGPAASKAQDAYAKQMYRLTAITGMTNDQLKSMNDAILNDVDQRYQMASWNERERAAMVQSIASRREENFKMGMHAQALEKQVQLQHQLYSMNDPKQRLKNKFKMQAILGGMGFGAEAADITERRQYGPEQMKERLMSKEGLSDAEATARVKRAELASQKAANMSTDMLNEKYGMGAALMAGRLFESGGSSVQNAMTNQDAYGTKFANALAPSEEQLKNMNAAINEKVHPVLRDIFSAIQSLREPFSGGGAGSTALQGALFGGTGLLLGRMMTKAAAGAEGGSAASRLGTVLSNAKGVVSNIATRGSSMISGMTSTASKLVPTVSSIATKGSQMVSGITSKAAPMLNSIASSSTGILNSAKTVLSTPAAAAIAKKAGVAGAALDAGFGVNDLLDGKRQTELSGWDYISPMRIGMWAGEKANQGYESLSGQSLGADIYDWMHGDEAKNAAAPVSINEINALRAKQGKAPLSQAQLDARKTGKVTTPAERNVPPTPAQKRQAEQATTPPPEDQTTAGLLALTSGAKAQLDKTQQMVDLLQQVLNTLADNGQNDRSDLAKLNKNARRTSNNTAQGTSMLTAGSF